MGNDTYYPQDGDYVEATVTIRGRVRRSPLAWFSIEYSPGKIWSFEDSEVHENEWKFTKVEPPLPTALGSRLALENGCAFVLSDDGWHQVDETEAPWRTDEITHGMKFEVIFDAGQGS